MQTKSKVESCPEIHHLHQGHSVFIRKQPYGVETIFGQIRGGLDPLLVGSENRADVRLSVLHKGAGESKAPFRSQLPRNFSPQQLWGDSNTEQATIVKTISERPHQASWQLQV